MDKDTVTYLLVAALVATAVLIALAVLVPRISRRAGRTMSVAAAGSPASLHLDMGDRGFSAMSHAGTRSAEAHGHEREASAGEPVTGATDRATGMLTPSGWGRVVADEDARVRRYRRPATIVMIELDGLDRLTSRLGDAAGNKLVPAVAESVRRLAREADHIAQLGHGRFGVLLPETDEIQAIHYIERVRRTCDLWLESGAVSLRLAIGWASASGDDSLHDAGRTATERMFAEVHRNARRTNDVLVPVSSDAGDGVEAHRTGV
jgi:diguanylate cyclase (GGDEF)-like protein